MIPGGMQHGENIDLLFVQDKKHGVGKAGQVHPTDIHEPLAEVQWLASCMANRLLSGEDESPGYFFTPRGVVQRRLFEVEQLVAPGEVEARPMLPSARYLPAESELAPGDLALPWDRGEDVVARGVVGQLALGLGAKTPGRLVASAKSWRSARVRSKVMVVPPVRSKRATGRLERRSASSSRRS